MLSFARITRTAGSGAAVHPLPRHGAGLARGLRPLFAKAWQIALPGAAAFVLLGYHPYAEDGGIYTAAVAAAADPALFPLHSAHVWATGFDGYSVFTPMAGAATRLLRAQPEMILFALQIASLLALLAAGVRLAEICFPACRVRSAAGVAMALGAGLPVAGTALYAVDPYATARSTSTPLLLFALGFALEGRRRAVSLCWLGAALVHPLMALWGAVLLLSIAVLSRPRAGRWIAGFLLAAVAAGALLTALSPAETAAARQAALTRAYWFPAAWRWYEWIGAFVPTLLLGLCAWGRRSGSTAALRKLVAATAVSTALGAALALCFARPNAASFAVGRLQPLRVLHLPFLAFLAVGGAWLRRAFAAPLGLWLAVPLLCLGGAGVAAMQRSLYSHTRHLEWPGTGSGNGWEQAFVWCRERTPKDALFALDADYLYAPGEDGHGFRAVALRNMLPDGVKDAGRAAVLPVLAERWRTGAALTASLDRISDAERRDRLRPAGVTWVVLGAASRTAMQCPFRNERAMVCRLD